MKTTLLMKYFLLTSVLIFGFVRGTFAQHTGLKTNTLYLATTTPNVGLEFRMGNQFTLSVDGGYHPFNFSSRSHGDDTHVNVKLRHWLVMPEMKYWFCQAFERSYIGLHGIYGEYNVGEISFIGPLKDYRYKGNAYGGGISWGYQWAMGQRWGVELSIGAGYLLLNYKKYDCGTCGDYLGKYKRGYLGPTKASLSLIYFLK